MNQKGFVSRSNFNKYLMMSNLILAFLIIGVCYLIFLVEKENHKFRLLASSGINFSKAVFGQNKNMINPNFEEKGIEGYSKMISKDLNKGLKLGLIKQPEIIDKKKSIAKKELRNNLKHLELIMTIESLTENDKAQIEKLMELEKVKKKVQLKVIELSNNLLSYQKKQFFVTD